MSKELALEEQKLYSLRTIDSKIETFQSSFNTILEEIAHLTLTFHYLHNEYVQAVNSRSDINSEDMFIGRCFQKILLRIFEIHCRMTAKLRTYI